MDSSSLLSLSSYFCIFFLSKFSYYFLRSVLFRIVWTWNYLDFAVDWFLYSVDYEDALWSKCSWTDRPTISWKLIFAGRKMRHLKISKTWVTLKKFQCSNCVTEAGTILDVPTVIVEGSSKAFVPYFCPVTFILLIFTFFLHFSYYGTISIQTENQNPKHRSEL